MKADLGASKTNKKEYQRHLKSLVTLLFGPHAILPNNEIIRASEQGDLNLHPKKSQSSCISKTEQQIITLDWSVM